MPTKRAKKSAGAVAPTEEEQLLEAAYDFFGGSAVSMHAMGLHEHLEKATAGLRESGGDFFAFGAHTDSRKAFVDTAEKELGKFEMTNIVCRPDKAVVREKLCSLKFYCGFNVLNGKGVVIVPMAWVVECEVSGEKVEVSKLRWLADLTEVEHKVNAIANPPKNIRKTSILKSTRRLTHALPTPDELRQFFTDLFPTYFDGQSSLEEQLSFVSDHFADEGVFEGPAEVHATTADGYLEAGLAHLSGDAVPNIAAVVDSVTVADHGTDKMLVSLVVWFASNARSHGLVLRQGFIVCEVDMKRRITRWEDSIYVRVPRTIHAVTAAAGGGGGGGSGGASSSS